MKVFFKVLLLSFACVAFLSGCTTKYGMEDKKTNINTADIVNQHKTKRELFILMGQPHDVQYNKADNTSMWRYMSVALSNSAVNFIPIVNLVASELEGELAVIDFTFDADGKVQDVHKFAEKNSRNIYAIMDERSTARSQDKSRYRVALEMEKLHLPFDETALEDLTGLYVLFPSIAFHN